MEFTQKQLEVMNFALQLLFDVLAEDRAILSPAELAALEDTVETQLKIQSALRDAVLV